MMAFIKVMKSRVVANPVASWSGKIGDVLDCIIPVALVAVVLVVSGLIAFGFVR
jgi:hypothetical protein